MDKNLVVACFKGAVYVFGWLAGIAGIFCFAALLLRISLSAIRLAAGSPECSPYKPICAALPTTFDYVLFGGALVVAFASAAFYFGYTRFYHAPEKKRDTWPWP